MANPSSIDEGEWKCVADAKNQASLTVAETSPFYVTVTPPIDCTTPCSNAVLSADSSNIPFSTTTPTVLHLGAAPVVSTFDPFKDSLSPLCPSDPDRCNSQTVEIRCRDFAVASSPYVAPPFQVSVDWDDTLL